VEKELIEKVFETEDFDALVKETVSQKQYRK